MGNNTPNEPAYVIWIDPNVDNEENTYYTKEMKKIKNIEIYCHKNVDDALVLIKYKNDLRFSETYIIVSGSLYTEFITKFEENLEDIFIIPKIIIFTLNKERFIENNKNYNDKSDSFYNFGGIQTSFDEIKNFLLKNSPKPISKKDVIEESHLSFEYIDCKEKLVLPLLYQSLIHITSTDNIDKYTEFLYNKYSTNKEINKLLSPIKNISDIPIKLLSKYYTRLYTIESQFCHDLNRELRGNEKDKFLPFIKLLYEGLKLKSLPIANDKILYRGSKISNDEIIKLKGYLKDKKPDLPSSIVFSKSYLSFSKKKEVAEQFLNIKNENKNLSKVLYIIEKDDNMDYSLSTHSDISEISKYPKEEEVLFFPFSSFEIKDIKEIEYNDEKIYEIKLLYLGKYLKIIENLDGDILESEFKTEMIESGLIPERKMKKTKEVIISFREERIKSDKIKRREENKNNENIEYNNEINLTYNIKNDEKKIHIFGGKFVENNKDKCKIIFNRKEYELNEYFDIKDYTNNRSNKLQIKLKYNNNIIDMSHMFNDCTSLSYIEKWDTNNVTNMSYMFNNCTSLSSLPDISKWNTDNVTNMSYIFSSCTSLSSLPDISKWNTNNVKNMSNMFSNCTSLLSLPDIEKWDTNNVIDMSYMFSNCTSLSSLPDISKWNTNNVTNMSYMFHLCSSLSSLPDLSKWNINNVINLSYIFYGFESLSSLPDISKWNTNNVTNMSYMFTYCKSISSLPDISIWNTNNVTNISFIFKHCTSLLSLPDISKWETNNVSDMSFMFSDCTALSSLPDISKWNTNNVTNMNYMFTYCTSLSSLPDISKWNTNNATNMSFIIYNCTSLLSLPDISKWNTSKVINMSYMFYNCKSLSSLPDISKWDTNNVTNMSYMFSNCASLSSLPDISKWNTNNVKNMSYMFTSCTSLSSLPDISKWKTNNVTNMSYMFHLCSSLSSLPDISKWITNKVTNMCYMFSYCTSLSSLPDISKWNTNNVKNMSYMFKNCKK